MNCTSFCFCIRTAWFQGPSKLPKLMPPAPIHPSLINLFAPRDAMLANKLDGRYSGLSVNGVFVLYAEFRSETTCMRACGNALTSLHSCSIQKLQKGSVLLRYLHFRCGMRFAPATLQNRLSACLIQQRLPKGFATVVDGHDST